MTTLNVQKRDTEKAKRLRKEGFITGNLFGKEIKDSILLKINRKDAEKLLQTCVKGSQLNLDLEGKTYDVLLKELGRDAVSGKVIDIEFQELVKGEKVRSTAEVILVNEAMVHDGVVELVLPEIQYKATPENIVDRVEIDCKGLKFGNVIKLGDLDIAKNANIELISDVNANVVTVIGSKITKEEEAEEAEEARIAAMKEAAAKEAAKAAAAK